ncbi:uncharacterized protein [Anabrus simplex]|uniref:uncharacterized protein isoform X2 n=1 Tax=Anabrus simplex TaxID=316456 RepID=UPI0035A37FF4
MAGGVLFRVYIPTIRHEKHVKELLRLKSNGSSAPSETSRHSKEDDTKSTSSSTCEDIIEFRSENEVARILDRPKIQRPFSAGKIRSDTPPQGSEPPQIASKETEDTSMEAVLKKVLQTMDIRTAVWCLQEDNNHYQVIFSTEVGEVCDEILRQLTECGIGSKFHSVISVSPCSLHYQGMKRRSANGELMLEDEQEESEDVDGSTEWSKFLASVRARLAVEQVVHGVTAAANLTFDFLSLLLVAAFLSALGLVENSTEILVGSMLISPLMGPVLAGTFGTMVGDRHLRMMGIRNELFGLLICLVTGYIYGFITGLVTDRWGMDDWPTEQMISRGQVRSIWVGILIALLSGAAVAIATLGDYTGSLVGVAISTALLPPAVNAGLLWSLACTDLIKESYGAINNTSDQQNRTFIYNKYPPADLAIMGSISVCLTLINIVCIFLAGTVVLKIKAVAPRTSKEQRQFWSHDVKLARDYNRTVHQQDADDDPAKSKDELSHLLGEDIKVRHQRKRAPSLITSPHELVAPSLFESALHQFTWSPGSRPFMNVERPTVRDLENLYFNITAPRSQPHFIPRINHLSDTWFSVTPSAVR